MTVIINLESSASLIKEIRKPLRKHSTMYKSRREGGRGGKEKPRKTRGNGRLERPSISIHSEKALSISKQQSLSG